MGFFQSFTCTTNNFMELRAFRLGLKLVLEHSLCPIQINIDSMEIIQILTKLKGTYSITLLLMNVGCSLQDQEAHLFTTITGNRTRQSMSQQRTEPSRMFLNQVTHLELLHHLQSKQFRQIWKEQVFLQIFPPELYQTSLFNFCIGVRLRL